MGIKWDVSPDQLIDAASRGLYRGVQRVMEKSRTQYCPKHTGNLASTGEVLAPVRSGGTVTCTAQYTAPYALYVHERNLRYRNGQWKYLSTAANEEADNVLDEIRAEVERAAR